MLKNFCSAVLSSFYNPAFYARVRTENLQKGVIVTAILGLIGAALLMLSFYVNIIPYASGNMLSSVEAMYPDALVITLAHGEVSINQPEPYYIKNTIVPDGLPNFVIFDTGDTLKGGAAENKTYVLVKKTYVVGAQSNGQERITHFDSNQATTTFAKADVTHFVDSIRPYVKPVILIGGLFVAVLGAFFVGVFWLGFHMLYLLVPGLLVFLYGKFCIPQMLWHESYVVALYASIPIAILKLILSFSPLALPIFMYTLLVMLVALINLTQSPHQHSLEHAENANTLQ